MRINKIADSNGFKLIAATLFLYPTDRLGIDYFWDYKDGILRVFTGMDHITYPVATWQDALKFILNAGNNYTKPRPARIRNGFKEVDPPNGYEPSSDTRYYVRVIRLPFRNWSDKVREIVNRWIESNSWRESCYCPGDCCGCEYSRSATWTYSAGKLTLRVTRHFNY